MPLKNYPGTDPSRCQGIEQIIAGAMFCRLVEFLFRDFDFLRIRSRLFIPADQAGIVFVHQIIVIGNDPNGKAALAAVPAGDVAAEYVIFSSSRPDTFHRNRFAALDIAVGIHQPVI